MSADNEKVKAVAFECFGILLGFYLVEHLGPRPFAVGVTIRKHGFDVLLGWVSFQFAWFRLSEALEIKERRRRGAK